MNKKVSRNDPCPCGSGLKYKKCCEKKEYAVQQKKFSGLRGVHAKPISSNVMSGVAGKVFKVLSDTSPGLCGGTKKIKSPRMTEEELVLKAEQRGYKTLEELIGVEGEQSECQCCSEGSETCCCHDEEDHHECDCGHKH